MATFGYDVVLKRCAKRGPSPNDSSSESESDESSTRMGCSTSRSARSGTMAEADVVDTEFLRLSSDNAWVSAGVSAASSLVDSAAAALVGDWPRYQRTRCTLGMDISRGKSRSSMGAAMSMAANRACSHLTNVPISMQDSKNWSVSARIRMTYLRL